MVTHQDGFDGNMAFDVDNKMSVGDHVVQEGYERGDGAIMDLVSANEKLVHKYAEQLCKHFGGLLDLLPEAEQKDFIAGIRDFGGNQDVMYHAMVARYDGQQAESVA
ncbi:MAG: hypothetical protein SGJ27_19520 [Candidatus Melainabacteria bacterium]|nr:hypothetical protein [Candidatus Melainabacteria bacterium]